jgi:hypothetical protein
MAYYQGKFKPKNPQKYKGDPTNIIYRSGWELKLFNHLDIHPNVLKWSSEEFFIPYISPIDSRWHRYFPDVYVEQINKDGKKEVIVIEVKPKGQTAPPNPQSRLTAKGNISRRYLNEVKTWGVNEAKWKYAEEFCLDRGWKFMILTEEQLFGKSK